MIKLINLLEGGSSDDDKKKKSDLDPGDIWDTDNDDPEDRDGYDIFKEKKSGPIKMSELGVTLYDEESPASQQAKQMGLIYKGFGRWADPQSMRITHKSTGGQLVPVDSGQRAQPKVSEPTSSEPEITPQKDQPEWSSMSKDDLDQILDKTIEDEDGEALLSYINDPDFQLRYREELEKTARDRGYNPSEDELNKATAKVFNDLKRSTAKFTPAGKDRRDVRTSHGYENPTDPMTRRQPVRTTKAGTANKNDLELTKTRLKDPRYKATKNRDPKRLPEEKKSGNIKLSELDVPLYDEESPASQQAKQMGLVYKGFGRWADPRSGKITHKSDGNRLVPVQSTSADPNVQDTPDKIDVTARGDTKKSSVSAPVDVKQVISQNGYNIDDDFADSIDVLINTNNVDNSEIKKAFKQELRRLNKDADELDYEFNPGVKDVMRQIDDTKKLYADLFSNKTDSKVSKVNLPGVGEVPRSEVGKIDTRSDGFHKDGIKLIVPGKGSQTWSMNHQADANTVVQVANNYGLKYLWPKGITKNANLKLKKAIEKAKQKGININYIDPQTPDTDVTQMGGEPETVSDLPVTGPDDLDVTSMGDKERSYVDDDPTTSGSVDRRDTTGVGDDIDSLRSLADELRTNKDIKKNLSDEQWDEMVKKLEPLRQSWKSPSVDEWEPPEIDMPKKGKMLDVAFDILDKLMPNQPWNDSALVLNSPIRGSWTRGDGGQWKEWPAMQYGYAGKSMPQHFDSEDEKHFLERRKRDTEISKDRTRKFLKGLVKNGGKRLGKISGWAGSSNARHDVYSYGNIIFVDTGYSVEIGTKSRLKNAMNVWRLDKDV